MRGKGRMAKDKRVQQLRSINQRRRKSGLRLLGGFEDLAEYEAGRQREQLAERKLCTVPECGRPHHARGLCSKHYKQWRRQNQLRPSDRSDLYRRVLRSTKETARQGSHCEDCSVSPEKRRCDLCVELSDVPPGVGK